MSDDFERFWFECWSPPSPAQSLLEGRGLELADNLIFMGILFN